MAAVKYGFVNGKFQKLPGAHQQIQQAQAGQFYKSTGPAGPAGDDYMPVVPASGYVDNRARQEQLNDARIEANKQAAPGYKFKGTPTPGYVAPAPTNPGGGGVYRGSTAVAAPAAPAATAPRIYTTPELAQLYGVNYDENYILNLLNEGSARKRDEVLGQIERDRANSLRSGQGMFGQYLDALRKTKSNAVATGINKGTLAAQELMALLGTQDKLSETELLMNQLSQKTFDEYATAAGMNKSLAFDNSNAIKQYLGTLSSNLNANDVQRYAAELAAKAAAGGGGGGYSYGGGSSGGSSYKNPDIEYAEYLKGLTARDRYILNGGR